MVEAVILLLIKLVALAIVVYLILWVLEIIGIPVPAKVVQLLWVIVALIALLFIYQTIVGGVGGLRPLH